MRIPVSSAPAGCHGEFKSGLDNVVNRCKVHDGDCLYVSMRRIESARKSVSGKIG